MSIETFDPAKFITTLGTIVISGYMDGTPIEAEYAEDGYLLKTGIDGESARSKNLNQSGSVKLTLKQTSPINDLLSALYAADRASNLGVVPFQMKDLLSATGVVAFARHAFIKKPPAVVVGKEIQGRQWEIVIPKWNTLWVGGNAIIGT